LLVEGREDLRALSSDFLISVGDSAYNASELEEFGFRNPGVLPIIINPGKWKHPPALDLMDKLQDGKTNLIFVGRIAPNKCQDDLLAAFCHYLEMDPDARLILVGIGQPEDPYYARVCSLIEANGLSDRVLLTGRATDAELQAYYRTADLFWSMSEHEGFGVPLIEAMWFDVPVCAYKSSAVPETLGMAGIMFNTKDDLVSVAALAKLVVKDSGLNAKIIRAQQQRRRDFLPQNVIPNLEDIIRKMESAAE
jgi:glycosyltransferase involved in cell wall biosynthesis